jgi:hypothetical protein
MPFRLSGKRLKEADRSQGLELLFRYPEHLGKPPKLNLDEEMTAGDAVMRWFRKHIEPVCAAHDLIVVRVKIVRLPCGITNGGRPEGTDWPQFGAPVTAIGAEIVSRRWRLQYPNPEHPPISKWVLERIE